MLSSSYGLDQRKQSKTNKQKLYYPFNANYQRPEPGRSKSRGESNTDLPTLRYNVGPSGNLTAALQNSGTSTFASRTDENVKMSRHIRLRR